MRPIIILAALLVLSGFRPVEAQAVDAGAHAPRVSPAPVVASRFSKVVDVVKDFGARGDGVADDWEAFQKAEGMNASGVCTYTKPTLVIAPPTEKNVYRISQAIRTCSYVTLWLQNRDTTIKGTGDAHGTDYTGNSSYAWPINGLTLTGSLGTKLYLSLPAYPIAGASSSGETHITLKEPASAGALVVGDIVAVETTSSYSNGAVSTPTQLQMAVVTARNATTGIVGLDRAIEFSDPSVQLRKLTNGAGSAGWPGLGGIPAFACVQCAIVGGKWLSANANPSNEAFAGAGGALDCRFEPDTLQAGFGLGYTNLYQSCKLSARQERIGRTALELALGSSHNTVDIDEITLIGATASQSPSGWALAIDQSSHDNKVSVGKISDYNGDINVEIRIVGTPSPQGGDVAKIALTSPTLNGGASVDVSYTTAPGDSRNRHRRRDQRGFENKGGGLCRHAERT